MSIPNQIKRPLLGLLLSIPFFVVAFIVITENWQGQGNIVGVGLAIAGLLIVVASAVKRPLWSSSNVGLLLMLAIMLLLMMLQFFVH